MTNRPSTSKKTMFPCWYLEEETNISDVARYLRTAKMLSPISKEKKDNKVEQTIHCLSKEIPRKNIKRNSFLSSYCSPWLFLPNFSYKAHAPTPFPPHLGIRPTGLRPFPTIGRNYSVINCTLTVDKPNGCFLVPIHLIYI